MNRAYMVTMSSLFSDALTLQRVDCSNCAHWTPNGDDGYRGKCAELADELRDESLAPVIARAAFSCSLWDRKRA